VLSKMAPLLAAVRPSLADFKGNSARSEKREGLLLARTNETNARRRCRGRGRHINSKAVRSHHRQLRLASPSLFPRDADSFFSHRAPTTILRSASLNMQTLPPKSRTHRNLLRRPHSPAKGTGLCSGPFCCDADEPGPGPPETVGRSAAAPLFNASFGEGN
jgi:hypothetical protein